MLSTVIADDLKARWCVLPQNCFFGAALKTPLGGHHVSLIEDLLVFLRKKKYFFALDTRNLYVRHIVISFGSMLALAKSNT